MNKPDILIIDIETTPHLSYTWGKYDQNVIAFKEYSGLLSISGKWLDDAATFFAGLNRNSEKGLLDILWRHFDKADAVIAHNGNAFDIPRVMALFAKHGMKPPSPFKHIDTKLMAKKHFSFPSNSLNDLADYLKIGRKKETGGFDLWLKCMEGDPKAWKTMLEYNVNDVLLLEKVYLRLLPFVTNHPNMGLFYGKEVCTNCGNDKMQSRGTVTTLTGTYTRLMCKKCGHWQRTAKKTEKVTTLRNI